MTETRADSWRELHDWLFECAWNDNLQRYRSTFCFRGAGRAGHGQRTSLERLGGDFAAKEPHLIRNFRKYGRRSLVGEDSIWNWLSLAKHHGLPTRLLDWTFSPYVALHFATASLYDFDADGEIIAVDYSQVHKLLPEKLLRLLTDEEADVFTVELLNSVATSTRELQRLTREPFLLFLEPPSLDERIVTQAALFSLMSDARLSLEEWLNQHDELHRRIVIPASLKWEIRDKLDQANINERVLFPGLDGLSAYLMRYYSERHVVPDQKENREHPIEHMSDHVNDVN